MREKLRAGYYYHIYNRGNNGQNIFRDEINYNFFLQRYGQYCYPVLDTYAYCLMNFHLLVRVRRSEEMKTCIANSNLDRNLGDKLTRKEWSPKLVSEQLGHVFNSYTQAFNKKYERTGSLFERPFERNKIDYRNYFCNLVCYLHRNPQLHGVCKDFKSYVHSSYRIFFSEQRTKINKEEVLDRFGDIKNFKTAHEKGMPTAEEFIIE